MESATDTSRTAWRTARAGRVAFLVDGAAYYSALAAAIERAQRSIILVGWDIDSRTLLSRPGAPPRRHTPSAPVWSRPGAPPETISALLNRVVASRRGLHVNLLAWDFAMVFALEREFFPVYHLGWKTHLSELPRFWKNFANSRRNCRSNRLSLLQAWLRTW